MRNMSYKLQNIIIVTILEAIKFTLGTSNNYI
jgi:hypothetical protein